MIARIGPALLAAALLAACQTAPPEQQWSKSGATVEDVKRDLYWCTTVQRGTPSALQTPVTARPATTAVDDECMEGRGYTKAATKS